MITPSEYDIKITCGDISSYNVYDSFLRLNLWLDPSSQEQAEMVSGIKIYGSIEGTIRVYEDTSLPERILLQNIRFYNDADEQLLFGDTEINLSCYAALTNYVSRDGNFVTYAISIDINELYNSNSHILEMCSISPSVMTFDEVKYTLGSTLYCIISDIVNNDVK